MRVRTSETIDLEPTGGADWKVIDSALRTIVHRRGALDALEAKWIREAVRVKIWREVGCVNMADYLERRLGYAPRTGYDRVRVAMALAELPKLAAALASGLPHSAVRALTRVCTNDNEQRWLDEVRGKSVHEIENMVSGRARGSDPEDPPDPSLVGKTLPFEGIRPATEALVRDARRMLQEERGPGEVLSDDDVLACFARMALEGRSGERTKAPYQIAVGLCERCGCGWQESGGRKYALSKADTERACCDAQWIGRVDDGAPDRATQDVSPSVRRMVHRRACGRCEIPGCRSTRCLEIHHIVARSLGGTHDAENLIVLCDGCHAAHHRGLIAIAGTASELLVRRKHEIAYDMVANDERARDPIERNPSASSNDPLETVHEPATHASPNFSRAFDAAVAHSRKRDAQHLDPSARVSTNSGGAIDPAVADHLAPTGHRGEHEPSAHVSTNSGRAIDAAVPPAAPFEHEPRGGVFGATVVSSDGFASTSHGQEHEPTAHVSTNSGHAMDAAVIRAAGHFKHEPSAHVSNAGRVFGATVVSSDGFASTSHGQEHESTAHVPIAMYSHDREPDRPSKREPSAHVSTNSGRVIDAVIRAADHFEQEPSAHVSNAGRVFGATVVSSDGFASTSDGEDHEPTAHVPTAMCSHDREPDRPLKREPSAHVSTSGSPSAARPSRFEQERIRTQARMALVTLGYRSGEAGKAVDLAIRYGHDTLETVIREALRSCIRDS